MVKGTTRALRQIMRGNISFCLKQAHILSYAICRIQATGKILMFQIRMCNWISADIAGLDDGSSSSQTRAEALLMKSSGIAIKKLEYHLNQLDKFQCEVYVKGQLRLGISQKNCLARL